MRNVHVAILLCMQCAMLPVYAESDTISPLTMQFLEANQSMSEAKSLGLFTMQDQLLGDSASGLTISNTSGSSLSLTAIFISAVYQASPPAVSACNATIGTQPGNTASASMSTPVTLINTNSLVVGKNYLYNMLSRYGDIPGGAAQCYTIKATVATLTGVQLQNFFGSICGTGVSLNVTCDPSAETCIVASAGTGTTISITAACTT